MKRNQFGIAVIGLVLLGVGAVGLAADKVDLGKREYDSKCAVCHGADGKGTGPYAQELKSPLPDLTTMAKRNGGIFPVRKTFEIIEGAGKGHGTRDMPVWGHDYTEKASELFPDLPYNQTAYVRTRINALMEYLAQMQGK